MRLGRALGTALLSCALVLAATGCDGSSQADDPQAPATTPAGSSTASDPSPSRSVQVADPEHAVDPPGPRKGAIVPADMLVFSPKHPLSKELVDRISHLKGVDEVNALSMGQVLIQNRAVNVAAVDPATYRLFTPAASAETQAVWDRVAGGELALPRSVSKGLPVDKQGYLRLGSTEADPLVHIGAYAPQIDSAIDAVVNEKWGEELGFQQGNALLISTGRTSPQSLRKPIERIVGDQASIQALDIVASTGIDPGVRLTAFVVGTIADAVGIFNYTPIGGGRIAPDPAWVRTHIATGQVPILGSVTCNRLIFPQLRAALQDVIDQGLADKIHPSEYAGCYYPRFIAGTTTLSNHSFGLALDLNVPGNQRGTDGQMDRSVVSIFKSWGFTWGGDWGYTDPMHFEMNRLVDPR